MALLSLLSELLSFNLIILSRNRLHPSLHHHLHHHRPPPRKILPLAAAWRYEISGAATQLRLQYYFLSLYYMAVTHNIARADDNDQGYCNPSKLAPRSVN